MLRGPVLAEHVSERGSYILGVLKLNVPRPFSSQKEVLIVGGLLQRRRHQGIPSLPFILVVGNFAEPLVERRRLAIRAGPRDVIDHERGRDAADSNVEGSLFREVSFRCCPVLLA